MNFVEQQDQIDFLVKPSWFLPGTKQWTKKFVTFLSWILAFKSKQQFFVCC